MLGNLMQLPTALTISRKKELAEILGVLGDESVGFLLGFLWKVTKIAKKLVAAWNLKEEQLSKYEELVQWGRDWNAVLMTTTCNIALLTDQYKQFTTATSPEASVARLQGLHEAYLSEVHKMLTRLRAGA